MICLLGCLTILNFPGFAQDSPTAGHDAANVMRAAGVVHTSQGVAVPGATVRLVELSSGRAWVSWTYENGEFELPGLPAGRYRVEAQQLGFEPASIEITLGPPPAEKEPQIELTLRIAPLSATVPEAARPPAANGEGAKPAAPGAPKGSGAPTTAAANKRGQAQGPGAAGGGRQRGSQGGFQQVEISGELSSAIPDISQSQAMETGPLGEASSSEAVLMSGTVVPGTTAGTFPGFGGQSQFGGPEGIGGGPGGFPVQPGMPGAMFGGVGPGEPGGPGGRGGPGGGRGGGFGGRGGGGPGGQGGGRQGGQGGQRQQFGEGAGRLYGVQRILRQQANRVRFSFYERYGNSALDARPYSLTQANPPKIADYRENWGASLGGPLYIPKVYNGRNKTFFFLNYSGSRSRNPVDTFATVPTLAERGGNFNDRGLQLQIPSNLISPVAQGLLQFIPLPNLPGLVQNFHLQTRVPSATDAFNMRALHTISPKLNASVIYNFSESRTHSFSSFPALEGNSDTRGQSLQLGLTQNWSTRLINDSRIIWSRSRINSLNNFSFADNVAGDLGITGISTAPIDYGIPQVTLTNFTGLNNPVPALRRNQTMRTLDNVSYILPKHTMKFGAELRRMQLNTVSDPTPDGLFTFTGLMTGFDFADFLLGLPQTTSIRFGSSSTYFRNWGFAAYSMDDWHVHPRFTFSYGLRYEAVTPPIELYDHIAGLAANSTFTQVATVTPGQVNPFTGEIVPQALVRGYYNNFSPRLGFAWRPKIKGLGQKHTPVVRGGYSVFYNLSIYDQLSPSMANQPPWAQAQTLQTSPQQVLTFQDGFPPAPPTVAKNTVAVDPNYRPGYAEMWNLAIEEQLTTTTTLDLIYTGTKGNHLDLQSAPNRTPPGTPSPGTITNALGFTYDTSGASSIYHALQVRVQRRLNKGLMIQGTYTFAKSIDNASSIGGGAPVVVEDYLHPELDRGLSSFDVRHQFRASFLYEFPFGDRKRWARGGRKNTLFGNWFLSGNAQTQTGTPYTAIVQGFTTDNSGAGNSFSERADQVANPNTGPGTPLDFFNKAAFVPPPPGRFGDAGRNTIIGPGIFVLNLGLAKQFRFGRDTQRRVDFRWDISNLTNTPNFTGLSTVVPTTIGAIRNNSTTYGRVLGTQAMRTMNFQLRVRF